MGDERSLTIRRGQLKGAITRFLTYIQSEELDPNQVSLRKEKIEEVWNEFDQVQTALELAEDSNENMTYRVEFEDLYFKAIVEANKIISPFIVKEAISDRGSVAMASDRSTGGVNIGTLSSGSTGKSNKYNNQFSSLMISAGIKCYVCQLSHTIYKCPTLIALSISERIKKVIELKLCKICLRRHENKRCLAKYCFKCSKPHNTLLHLVQDKEKEQGNKTSIENAEECTPTTSSSISAHAVLQNEEQVLLSTAVAHIRNSLGENVECRILLDSGSQCNLITENMVQNIRLKRHRVQHTVMGVGGATQPVSRAVNVSIASRYNSFNLTLTRLVVQKITHCMPNNEVGNFETPDDINLADSSFRRPQKIDLLFGNKHFFEILCPGQIRPNITGPIFQETHFGWVVAGPVSNKNLNETKGAISIMHTVREENNTHLENLLSTFWRLEKMEAGPPLTIEEKMCKRHFDETVQQDKNGRFIIRLPFKNTNALTLGKSYHIARRRWAATENRLKNNNQLREAYTEFMHEYEALGHMERVRNEEIEELENVCYLPHHAVVNENSTTTKLRVVFDASCKTESGNSLNDTLLKGPVLQDELLYILSRFRTHNYVLSADIAKMYRQIKVAKDDCDYQRILWRADPKLPLQVYRLTTLTYGTVPASFIATACLAKLADTGKDYLRARESIKTDFYMDDYLSGASTKEEAIGLQREVQSVLEQAGFELRKWTSNDPSIINSNMSTGEKGTSDNVRVFDCAITKILGLFWDSNADVLRYKVSEYVENTAIINKRKILSDIATIFDPLGLVGPVVKIAKLFMQNVWQLRVNWDEPLPKNVTDEWLKYKKCLPLLKYKLLIPRIIISTHDNPAYIISRGCYASQIATMELWWCRPKWLCKNKEEWPSKGEDVSNRLKIKNIPDSKNVVQFSGAAVCKFLIVDKYSSSDKIIRITTYCMRYYNKIKKSMKSLLRTVLCESYLTYEELYTILTRVEACLNSRPLTGLSSDPSDLSYITPAHFLIGDSLMSIPERDETNTPVNRLDRWRRVRQFSQILWKRWSREYLHQLQERSKWASEKGPQIEIDSVVLIREENLSPLRWRIVRVREVTRGNDGIIRTAVVKTVDGLVPRAVRKLCPLPFEKNND